MTVLVLTRPLMDGCADVVIDELNTRGVPVHRMDPGDFPESLAIASHLGPGQSDWTGTWHGQHRDLSLNDISAVYYRRPGTFRTHPALSAEDARWARDEARAGFIGVLSSLRCVWVNHPRRNGAADSTPVALATAARCGLRVPRTLITNDPTQARSFIASLPGKVAAYKAMAAAGPLEDGRQYAVWTSRIREQDVTPDVARTAHLFQEWITKRYEVRVTCVGERVFAAEIHAGSDASRIDFRRDYDSLTYRECTVPTHIVRGLHRLMAAFDLRYLATDFLVNKDNDWHLVDVNPNGQFGFIPDLCEPITSAIADELEGTTA
jgi:ATP-grasp ribosomal peptide maturase